MIQTYENRQGSAMLSRVADSLYWMSRYIERAEHTARLLNVHFNLALDSSSTPGKQRWSRLLTSLRSEITTEDVSVLTGDPYKFAHALTFDATRGGSIVASITGARENARQVRELISSEVWEHINRLYLQIRNPAAAAAWNDQPQVFFQNIKEAAHLFQGLADSTMTHGEGWRYIQLGRYIERAGSIATLLDVHFTMFPQTPGRTVILEEYFEWLGLLKCCTAFEAYCKVYSADIHPDYIAEFLLCNNTFPHSVHFCAERIQHALTAIADSTNTSKNVRVHKLAGKLAALLSYYDIGEILDTGLHSYLVEIQNLCSAIHDAVHEFYIAYSIESALER